MSLLRTSPPFLGRDALGLGTPGTLWAGRGTPGTPAGDSRDTPGLGTPGMSEELTGRGEELNLTSDNPTPRVGNNTSILYKP